MLLRSLELNSTSGMVPGPSQGEKRATGDQKSWGFCRSAGLIVHCILNGAQQALLSSSHISSISHWLTGSSERCLIITSRFQSERQSTAVLVTLTIKNLCFSSLLSGYKFWSANFSITFWLALSNPQLGILTFMEYELVWFIRNKTKGQSFFLVALFIVAKFLSLQSRHWQGKDSRSYTSRIFAA